MKKLFLLGLAITMFYACQNKPQRYFGESAEIETLKAGINAYESGDWSKWKTHFADTAKIYVNTASPVSVDERRSSYGDLIDGPKFEHEHHGCSGHNAMPFNKITLPSQPTAPPLKLVNLITDGGGTVNCHGYNGVNNNNSHIMSNNYLIGNSHKPLNQATRRDKKVRAHQRLCRKKSRSQENLSSRRRISSANDNAGVILNNRIQPQPLTASHLSRSEGSIHNVHKIVSSGGSSNEGSDGTLCGGVTDLAKVKKLQGIIQPPYINKNKLLKQWGVGF